MAILGKLYWGYDGRIKWFGRLVQDGSHLVTYRFSNDSANSVTFSV